jgi:hypothetical protein
MNTDAPTKWPEIITAFMDRAKSVGVTGRRFVLCLLAFLAMLLMMRGISPPWCIAFVVILYILEPVVEIGRTIYFQRGSGVRLAAERTQFRRFVTRRERQLRGSEPELPLSLPEQRQPEETGEGQ